MRLYLDASAIIYSIEGGSTVRQAVVGRLREIQAAGGGSAILTSLLGRLECRTKPLASGNAALLAGYDRFFESEHLSLLPITPDVIETATLLRAHHRLKTADAIHVASAMAAGADEFLTGDVALARCNEVPMTLLRP
jgi:predicted nucleic acid-binding protein